MKCEETESLIQPFLGNEIKGRRLSAFLEHVKECESCKEELTIQYLCSEGIARLEEGKTFDLDRELGEYMQNSLLKYKKKKRLRIAVIAFEVIAVLVILGVFFYAFVL